MHVSSSLRYIYIIHQSSTSRFKTILQQTLDKGSSINQTLSRGIQVRGQDDLTLKLASWLIFRLARRRSSSRNHSRNHSRSRGNDLRGHEGVSAHVCDIDRKVGSFDYRRQCSGFAPSYY
mmetsp:Transcript_20711/g.29660  ORF Transcript_20711/g.29660 Transcript_20711/m.29660 type:complete len:120 (+) Transcript_20711:125-484(+)